MFTDIAIPKNNESEFVEIAARLGIKKLYFLYSPDEYGEDEIQKKLNSINAKINLQAGLIASPKNLSKDLRQPKLIAAKSSDKDRLFIESKKIELIYGFEESRKRDYLHQRASGLNHSLCGLAEKNGVAVGFSYSSLFNQNSQIAALLMGRMMQNIALCQKYNVKTAIGSFSGEPFKLRSPHDVKSLFAMLGMDSKKINESMSSVF